MVGLCMVQVEKLHQELDGEIKLKRVLQCALQGPVHSCPYSSSLMLPTKVAAYQGDLFTLKTTILSRHSYFSKYHYSLSLSETLMQAKRLLI